MERPDPTWVVDERKALYYWRCFRCDRIGSATYVQWAQVRGWLHRARCWNRRRRQVNELMSLRETLGPRSVP